MTGQRQPSMIGPSCIHPYIQPRLKLRANVNPSQERQVYQNHLLLGIIDELLITYCIYIHTYKVAKTIVRFYKWIESYSLYDSYQYKLFMKMLHCTPTRAQVKRIYIYNQRINPLQFLHTNIFIYTFKLKDTGLLHRHSNILNKLSCFLI